MATSREAFMESMSTLTVLSHEDLGQPLIWSALLKPREHKHRNFRASIQYVLGNPHQPWSGWWWTVRGPRGGLFFARKWGSSQITGRHIYIISISTQRHWFSSPRSVLVPRFLIRRAVLKRPMCYTIEPLFRGKYEISRCSTPTLQMHFGESDSSPDLTYLVMPLFWVLLTGMSNHTRLPPLLMTWIISNVLATAVLYFFSNGVNKDNTSFVWWVIFHWYIYHHHSSWKLHKAGIRRLTRLTIKRTNLRWHFAKVKSTTT